MHKVTPTENLSLIQPVTEEEIQQALFQMNPCKAPRSDGFCALFFQKFWPLFKDRLCSAIQDFFCTGKLLKQFNYALIALIPKVDNPEVTPHFHPISPCNTFYKIIAKILVNRMRLVLERLVQPTQSIFVPRRAIHDNILLAHVVLNKFHHIKGRKGYVAIKLDMKKKLMIVLNGIFCNIAFGV